MKKLIEKNEYAPYYSPYVDLVSEGNIIEILEKQIEETSTFLKNISDQQALFRYAPEKWSIKEVIGHMADTERIMAYRLLSFARGETNSLPGFSEMEYVQHAFFDKQSIDDLIENLIVVRQSTIQLVKSLSNEALQRRGIANNHEITVRALIVIITGHELHHGNILNERYISSDSYPRK
ncbi:DinB family protein [Psychrobacillus sp. FJAT-21963]|uniref:DinB family protein n=1 Tax=Psychrobacillus sp. FJAT-21963 TaxID=1712028 RepID=UPI0006F63C6A|nr:DinB family protein [Psychrobacillus sp. FJAT-21963]KQL33277.1 damage-inducible protein DinB [Psychrobacillus sp. FJAT-21963]